MQQYFLDEIINENEIVQFSKEQQHHIRNVLRMKTGDVVKVVDKSVTPFLVGVNIEDEVNAKIIEKLDSNQERVKITLIQGMIKGERWDFLIQKASELGVDTIIPMISSRTVVKTNDKIDKKLQRFNKIALEACEQSKRDHLVEVKKPVKFKEIDAYQSQLNLIAYEDASIKSEHLKDILQMNPSVDSVTIIVGSEGGFSLEEVEEAERKGFIRISLGSRILRSETAAMASIQSMMFFYE